MFVPITDYKFQKVISSHDVLLYYRSNVWAEIL